MRAAWLRAMETAEVRGKTWEYKNTFVCSDLLNNLQNSRLQVLSCRRDCRYLSSKHTQNSRWIISTVHRVSCSIFQWPLNETPGGRVTERTHPWLIVDGRNTIFLLLPWNAYFWSKDSYFIESGEHWLFPSDEHTSLPAYITNCELIVLPATATIANYTI